MSNCQIRSLMTANTTFGPEVLDRTLVNAASNGEKLVASPARVACDIA
jgi:hypothetical protein